MMEHTREVSDVHAHATTAAMCPVFFRNGRIYPRHSAGRDTASRDSAELRRTAHPISREMFIIARVESRGIAIRVTLHFISIYT